MKKFIMSIFVLVLCVYINANAQEKTADQKSKEVKVTFSTKPTVTKKGDKTILAFTISAPFDIEIAVLDAKEKIIRHLAAGILDANKIPPEPLKPGLSQSVEWDGKDDFGNVASGGPFKFRVRAGLDPQFDGFVGESKYWVLDQFGIATDKDGNLYVHSSSVTTELRGRLPFTQVFNRKGEYVQTIMPMPNTIAPEKLKSFNVILDEKGSSFTPRNYLGTWPVFYPGPSFKTSQLASRVSADGSLLFWGGPGGIGRVKSNGESVGENMWQEVWPAGDPNRPNYAGGPNCLATSPDGNTIYLSGLSYAVKADNKEGLKADAKWPDGRIYRLENKTGALMTKFVDLPLPDNAPSFIDTNTSYGRKHSGTGGADCDAQGNLVVCDRMNKRLRVFNPEGKEIGGFALDWGQNIQVHRKTGVIYVMTNQNNGYRQAIKKLLKFSSWKEGKLLAEFTFASGAEYSAELALDDSTDQAILWCAGSLTGKPSLLRVEDKGDKFEVTANLMDLNKDRFGVKPRIAVHPETDLIICNDGSAELNGYEGLTGNEVKLPFPNGADVATGLDGNWYIQIGSGYSGYICRFDKNLKEIPVAEPAVGGYLGRAAADKNEKPLINALGFVYGRMGAGFSTFGAAVDKIGRVYSLQMYIWSAYCVAIFGPNGQPEDPGRFKEDPDMKKTGRFSSAIIVPIGTKCGGIQLDYKNNIYLGLSAFPLDHKPPFGFDKDEGYQACVGSVVKFKAEGGSIVKADKAPAGKPGMKLSRPFHGVVNEFFAENAERCYPELGCLGGDLNDGCICRQPMFQVDGWGRIFIPNALTCSVNIVDNEGNMIQKLGSYGNIDSRGGTEGKGPKIPLAWPQAVATSEKAIYISDVANRRIVRLLKKYAVEEICEMK